MNITDIIIIYLACGAPFGVHYLLNNRKEGSYRWLGSSLVSALWLPYALLLLHKKITKSLTNIGFVEKSNLVSDKEQKIELLKKNLEDFLPEHDLSQNLFEFREMIERYSGLTYALDTAEGNGKNAELYQVVGHENSEIAALCLNRRNLLRLRSHQTEARRDFLESLDLIFQSGADLKKVCTVSLEFVKLLEDYGALTSVENLIRDSSPLVAEPYVTDSEKELWNSEMKRKLMNDSNSQTLRPFATPTKSPNDA